MAIYYGDGSNSGAGRLVQVVQDTKYDVSSTTSSSFADISGLAVTITPKSSSNKILVTAELKGWAQNSQMGAVRLRRGSTDIYIGSASDSREQCSGAGWYANGSPAQVMGTMVINYLDSPNTTSSTTYKLRWRRLSNIAWINRTSYDANNDDNCRTVSSITVMEIAA